jgi:spore maturation protein CgeB
MKILLIYPGATWSVYDVAAGYERALRLLGHDVVVFDYHTQYKFFKQYLYFLERSHGVSFPKDAEMVLSSERVAINILDTRPDAILNIMGIGLHRRAYEHAAILDVPMALVLTESPYMDEHQRIIAEKGHVRLIFANDKSSLPYLSESGIPTVYLPHSYDPARHYPHQVNGEYQSDVFFHGTMWPRRQQLFDALDLSTYDAHVGGADFSGSLEQLSRDVVDNDELVRYYSGTKIALNHHRQTDHDGTLTEGAWSLGPRAFEIAACGAFQLCDESRDELYEVFGASVGTYSDAKELQMSIDHYLEFEDEREDRAKEARRRVRPCSFKDRARDVVVPAMEQYL